MDHGFGDTLGLVSLAHLDDLGYLPPLHFTPRHSILNTFMLISILLEFDRYFPSFGSYISLWHMTSHLTLWIREECRPILDFPSRAFMYLLDFEFNIFHDNRAWQITIFFFSDDDFILTIDMLSFNLLAFCVLVIIIFLSTNPFCLSARYLNTWSCLAFPFEVGHLHYMVDEHIPKYSSSCNIPHLNLFTNTCWGIPPLFEVAFRLSFCFRRFRSWWTHPVLSYSLVIPIIMTTSHSFPYVLSDFSHGYRVLSVLGDFGHYNRVLFFSSV